MTDIDSVAEAIWRADLSMFETLFKGKTWETLDEQWHNLYRGMARAAIDAMAPTEKASEWALRDDPEYPGHDEQPDEPRFTWSQQDEFMARIRNSPTYLEALERDKDICVCCGQPRGAHAAVSPIMDEHWCPTLKRDGPNRGFSGDTMFTPRGGE